MRLETQHRSVQSGGGEGFLAGVNPGSPDLVQSLARGEKIEKLTPKDSSELPGAMLHHWRGTAFAPGATVLEFERLMKDLADYPKIFAPQVVAGSVVSRQSDDHLRGSLRMRQHHGLTVVLDSTYQVDYVRPDARHGYHSAISSEVREVENAGSARERVLPAGEGHGYLWRQNTYWSYEQADGGLYLQVESISLTRSIPAGLGWAIGPFVESIPRESLEFTLQGVLKALHK